MMAKLRVAKKSIDYLKNTIVEHVQEIKVLHSKLSVNEVHLGTADLQLYQAKRETYEKEFLECKALAKQILLLVDVNCSKFQLQQFFKLWLSSTLTEAKNYSLFLLLPPFSLFVHLFVWRSLCPSIINHFGKE